MSRSDASEIPPEDILALLAVGCPCGNSALHVWSVRYPDGIRTRGVCGDCQRRLLARIDASRDEYPLTEEEARADLESACVDVDGELRRLLDEVGAARDR